MARSILLLGVTGCLLLAGCSRSPVEDSHLGDLPQAPAPSESAAAITQVPTSDSSPDRVVEAFLLALRNGNDEVASALLTTKARSETAKHNLIVAPPGSPDAEFYVGEIEFIDPNQTGAHVKSIWSEADGQHEISYELVWALRQQSDGWRIAGMATEIVPGQRPVFLNFEDPSDMIDKMERAERIATRHQEATRDAEAIQR